MKKTILAAVLAFGATFGVVTYARYAEADSQSTLVAQVAPDAGVLVIPAMAPVASEGSGSAVAPAPAPATTTPATAPSTDPQLADVSLVGKLWKNKSFLGLAVLAAYLALFVWAKVDKKRAFYSATALAGVVILVDSIRQGNTPNLDAITHALGPTIGLLIAGPNHVKA